MVVCVSSQYMHGAIQKYVAPEGGIESDGCDRGEGGGVLQCKIYKTRFFVTSNAFHHLKHWMN